MRLRPLVTFLALSTVLAVSGTADATTRVLQFEIEPVIIMNCIGQVDYTIDTKNLLALGSASSRQTKASASRSGSRKIDARFSADTLINRTSNSIVEVDVQNACSLRGLGRGEGFLVDVKAVNQGLLVNPKADGILTVKSAMGKTHYNNSYANRFTIPQKNIRLDRAIRMDIRLLVDLKYATGSGRYSSPVDGVFSIEVSAP